MYNETEQKERRKIIAIIIATVVLILALVVAIVVTATNKSHKSIAENENSSFVIMDEKEPEADQESEDDTEPKASELGEISTETSTTSDAPAVSSVSSLPDTGAEDLLPIALMLGVATTFATSLVMSKKAR